MTLRFQAAAAVDKIKPILKWDDLVPAPKLAVLHHYGTEKGYPPRGDNAPDFCQCGAALHPFCMITLPLHFTFRRSR